MRLPGIIFLSFISFSALAQHPNTKVAGDWEGTLSAAGRTMKVVFHISYDGKDLTATMDRPDQNAFGLKVDEVSFKDGILKMKSNIVQGSYEGTVKQNKAEGKWTQRGQSFDLKLEKKRKKGTS